MVQLQILSGRKAGFAWVPRELPVRIGRSASCDLQLEEPGVWNEHFTIEIHPGTGIVLQAFPDALVTANGQLVQHTVLRNGDTVEVGALKMRFWLSEASQGRSGSGWLLAFLIGAVWAAQIALAVLLPH
jgi:predicted component of type VI protein secretion system